MIIDTSQWAFISAKLYYQRLKRITESAKQNFFLSLHSHRNVQTHSRLFWHAQSSLAFFGLSLSLTILIHSFFFVDGAFLHSLLLTALISTSPYCPSAWEIKIKFVTFFYINQVFLLRLKIVTHFLKLVKLPKYLNYKKYFNFAFHDSTIITIGWKIFRRFKLVFFLLKESIVNKTIFL